MYRILDFIFNSLSGSFQRQQSAFNSPLESRDKEMMFSKLHNYISMRAN